MLNQNDVNFITKLLKIDDVQALIQKTESMLASTLAQANIAFVTTELSEEQTVKLEESLANLDYHNSLTFFGDDYIAKIANFAELLSSGKMKPQELGQKTVELQAIEQKDKEGNPQVLADIQQEIDTLQSIKHNAALEVLNSALGKRKRTANKKSTLEPNHVYSFPFSREKVTYHVLYRSSTEYYVFFQRDAKTVTLKFDQSIVSPKLSITSLSGMRQLLHAYLRGIINENGTLVNRLEALELLSKGKVKLGDIGAGGVGRNNSLAHMCQEANTLALINEWQFKQDTPETAK